MDRYANINDVAAAAGVSTATVSRVFNRRGNVQESTRSIVLSAARRLKYEPQVTALRDCIAIAIEDFSVLSEGGYNNALISALSREISRRGHRIEIIAANEIPVLSGKIYHGLVSCLYSESSLALLKPPKDLPLVTINDVLPGIPAVISNDLQGMEAATGALLAQGHQRIGLLARKIGFYSHDQRRQGFLKAMAKAGRPLTDTIILETTTENSLEIMVRMLAVGVTGIVCTCEEQGLYAYRNLAALGRRVPEEISLVAYEYHKVSAALTPAQTAIAQDFEGLAKAALDLMQAPTLRRRANTTPRVLVDYLFYPRASIAAP